MGGNATELLVRMGAGDQAAAGELLPLVYEQLREMAGNFMRNQPAGHTLQPTALVNEAYLKLIASSGNWKDRAHFCAVTATAMRQILQNHARGKRAAKRSGQRVNITIDRFDGPEGAEVLDLVALEDALTKLAELNMRQARLVELRFFGGMTHDEIAHVLGVTTRTVEKDWRRVRAWLSRELSEESRQ